METQFTSLHLLGAVLQEKLSISGNLKTVGEVAGCSGLTELSFFLRLRVKASALVSEARGPEEPCKAMAMACKPLTCLSGSPQRHRVERLNPFSQEGPEGLWGSSVHPVTRAGSHFGHNELIQQELRHKSSHLHFPPSLHPPVLCLESFQFSISIFVLILFAPLGSDEYPKYLWGSAAEGKFSGRDGCPEAPLSFALSRAARQTGHCPASPSRPDCNSAATAIRQAAQRPWLSQVPSTQPLLHRTELHTSLLLQGCF